MSILGVQGRWRLWREGVAGPLLPEWVSYQVSVPRAGVGGFSLVLPLDGVNVSALKADPWAFLGFEVMAADGTWAEPPNCRMVPVRRTVDYRAGTISLSGASYGWLLGKAVRWFMPGDEDADGKKVFVNASAGHILQWHYYWAAVRRALQNVTIDFDEFADSDAVSWVDRFDVEYERGVTLRAIFDGFDANGIVWRTYGDTVQVAQGEFADVPSTVPVLNAGVDVEVDQVELSTEDAAGSVMMVGQNTRVGAAGAPFIGPWGRWEVSVSQSGTTTDETLARMAQVELARRGLSRQGATVTLLPSADYRPWETIFPGQVVTVMLSHVDGGIFRWGRSRWDGPDVWGSGPDVWAEITERIEEMVVADDGTEATVSFTLGERARSATELLTETVAGVTGGRIARRTLSGRAS